MAITESELFQQYTLYPLTGINENYKCYDVEYNKMQ